MHFISFIRKNKKTLVPIFIILTCLSIYIYKSNSHKNSDKNTKKSSYLIDCSGLDIPDSVKVLPTMVLNDKNDVHLAYAKVAGLKKLYISNQEFEEECDEAVKEQTLVKIDDNPLYYVKKLRHSYPYVIPEMGDLLNEIAYRFKKNLPEKLKNDFRFVITSGLRTNETQQDLSKYNRNASATSAHLFGTTVDISYKDFFSAKQDTLVQDWEALQALTKTMQQLRMECRFVSVRERRQACFHTTLVVCKQ